MRLPNLALMIVVVSWGFNFVAVKVVYREMTAPALSLVRFFVMYVLLVGLCWAKGESIRYRRDWLPVLFCGLLSMGVYMILFLEGMKNTTPAEGAIVLATAPLFTYFLACCLKQERFLWGAFLGAWVAFGGVAMVVMGGASGGHGSLAGNLVILASAITWSVVAVMMKPLLTRYDATQLFTMSMPGALVVLLPYGWSDMVHTNYRSVSPYAWLMFAQMAVMSGVVAFACFYAGIKQVGASQATMYQFLVPPFAALSAWWVLGKSMASAQLLGMAIVLGGVLLASKARASGSPTVLALEEEPPRR